MTEEPQGLLLAMREFAQTLSKFRPANSSISKRYLSQSGLKNLHLGGGRHTIDGWLNTDRFCRHGIVYVDLTKRFPFPDNSFDHVYSEHAIEHLPYRSGLSMLRESFRVLRPGGRVRIATPDFVFLKNLHNRDKTPLQQQYISWSLKEWVGSGLEEHPEMFVINNFVRAWGHQFIYDEATLRQTFEMAGFVQIRKAELNRSIDPVFCGLENESRMPAGFLKLESLILEASKP
jgi:predicted SAM-dependent methyltransferase